MQEIKRAIVPISTQNIKFLPLSRMFPKAACPIVDKPIFYHLVKEIKESEISEVVFVVDSPKNFILDYLQSPKTIETALKKSDKEYLENDFKELSDVLKNLSINVIVQTRPVASAHAILQAVEKTSNQPAAVLFCDYLIDSEEPCIAQLIKVFSTSQRPVLGLTRISSDKNNYKLVDVEQISKRVSKIKQIDGPKDPYKAPSDLAIIGRYIFTPEYFDYLKEERNTLKDNLTLIDGLNKMMADGKSIYGYEFEGKLLECNNKLNWLKTNMYYSLKDNNFGSELKNFVKNNKLID